MSQRHTKRRFSRHLRKKLIYILTALNKFDFHRLLPFGIILCASIILLLLCLLPTSRTDNSGSPEARLGEYLAGCIRSAAAAEKSDAIRPDIVALFLSKDEIAAFSSDNTSTVLDAAMQKPFYSIYITGKELYALAESAVSFSSALSGTTVFLSGLNYSYHPLRLPMNRIMALSFSDGRTAEKESDVLYCVITTEELFSLLESVSHRSLGIMKISPKDQNGTPLSDYKTAMFVLPAGQPYQKASSAVSVVTKLGGFNLLTLLEQPNWITLYVLLLFVGFVALLSYCIPRIRRVRLWIRIHAIHRRKRGYTARRRKKNYYRKAS